MAMKTHTEINFLRTKLSSVMGEKKLTQIEVTQNTGVTQAALSLFLSGKRGLSGEAVLRLQKFLESQQSNGANNAT